MGRHRAALAATLGVCTSGLVGQETDTEPAVRREWFGHRPWLEWEHAAGDVFGLRTQLDELGVQVGGGVIFDWSAAWSGGRRNRDTGRSLLDINVGFDGEKLLGIRGLTLFVDAYSKVGRDGSADVGDIGYFSNIDTRNLHQIAEAWVEQKLFDDKLRIKIGKVDANSEFGFVEAGGELVNASAGFAATSFPMPSYPDPATGVNLFAYPGRCYVGLGFYDGAMAEGVPTGSRGPRTFFSDDVSSSWFTIGEAGVTWGGGGDSGHGRLAVGFWHHTATFERFDGGTENGLSGFYGFCEHRVWRENPDSDDDQGLDLFLSVGQCDGRVSTVANMIMLGGCWRGPLRGRDQDALSCSFAHFDLSDDDAAGFPRDERAVELNYKLQLTPCFVVRPCLHYIMRPSGDPDVDDALVGMLRLEANF